MHAIICSAYIRSEIIYFMSCVLFSIYDVSLSISAMMMLNLCVSLIYQLYFEKIKIAVLLEKILFFVDIIFYYFSLYIYMLLYFIFSILIF